MGVWFDRCTDKDFVSLMSGRSRASSDSRSRASSNVASSNASIDRAQEIAFEVTSMLDAVIDDDGRSGNID